MDDTVAAVGSTNLDNRSLHLNFEVMVASSDDEFIQNVEEMFQRDFGKAKLTPLGALDQQNFWFQIIVGVARLFSPVL